MPISYSGIINYGKATLPSVESWGTNNNILRDPPRSITTRRTDKVFDTAMIDQEIQESGNRVAESIRVYPRGANVMVGVSFNNSNSVGTRGNIVGSQQAKLPYRIMRDGAFRPPILRPVNLLPLSRLPRNVTTIDPVAYTTDFKRKIVCPGTAENYRSVKNTTLQVNTNTAKVKNIQRPVEVAVGQNIVQNKLHTDAEAKRTRNVQRPVEIAAGQNIIQNKIHADAEANKTRNVQRPMEIGVTQNIIQNKIHADAEANKTRNVQRPVEVSVGQSIVPNKIHADAEANKTRNVQRPVEIGVVQYIQKTLTKQAQTNARKYDYGFKSVKHTDDAVKTSMLHYQSQSNPTQNVHVRNVEPVIIYQTNARPQASTTSNIKGVGKQYVLHEVQELRDKPVLRGEVVANANRRGMYAPDSQQPMSRDLLLSKRANYGSKESMPMIPTFDRSVGEAKLKGTGFYDMMRNKNNNK